MDNTDSFTPERDVRGEGSASVERQLSTDSRKHEILFVRMENSVLLTLCCCRTVIGDDAG